MQESWLIRRNLLVSFGLFLKKPNPKPFLSQSLDVFFGRFDLVLCWCRFFSEWFSFSDYDTDHVGTGYDCDVTLAGIFSREFYCSNCLQECMHT